MDLRDQATRIARTASRPAGSTSGRNVLGAWQWLRARGHAAETIGLYGGSMGAGSVAFAMGNEPAVAAGFLDSPYADILSSSTAYAVAHDRPAGRIRGPGRSSSAA